MTLSSDWDINSKNPLIGIRNAIVRGRQAVDVQVSCFSSLNIGFQWFINDMMSLLLDCHRNVHHQWSLCHEARGHGGIHH